MERKRWLCVLMAWALFLSALMVVRASPAVSYGLVRKIVIFDTSLNEPAREALVQQFGGVVVKHLPLVDGMAVLLPPHAVEALAKRAGVVRVDDDLLMYALPKPDKPGKPPKPTPTPQEPPEEVLPWGVDQIDAELAWSVTKGAGVKVAVLDTGIDLEHPDLNVAGGVNTLNPRKSYDDDNGHGTHVAGIIAALDNEVGVVGVAPEAQLYAVKVLNRQGVGFLSDIIEGLQWCIGNDIQVINISLGGGGNETYHQAIRAAYEAGTIIVAAAGNDGPSMDSVSYPAKYPETIAVSAVDSTNVIAAFSSRGSEVDLAAPGVEIYSTWLDGNYRNGSGTSMAAPHVAGAAALVIASGRAATPEEVRAILQNAADDLGDIGVDPLYGYGFVDAEEAATGVQTLP